MKNDRPPAYYFENLETDFAWPNHVLLTKSEKKENEWHQEFIIHNIILCGEGVFVLYYIHL